MVTSPLSGTSAKPLSEGVTFVFPGSQVDVFDLRQQERNEDLVGIAADGASVAANASVVAWRIVGTELVAFDREIGPHPYERIIRPIVQSAVRMIIAQYPAFELMDTRNLPRIQALVTARAGLGLRPMHIELETVYLRSLVVVSAPLTAEIIDTSRLEQQLLTMPHAADLVRARGEQLREEGRATAATHALVAPTLSPGTLGEQSARAWEALLSSKTSTVVVTGPTSKLEVSP